jgi:hypothetical protein
MMGPSMLSMANHPYRLTSNGGTTAGNPNYFIEVDEFKFFKIIKNVLKPIESFDQTESLDWLLSMDIYDLLDSSVMESIGFREFCALIYLVSSAEAGLLLRCLYDHGPLLFDILGAGQPLITGDRLKVIGDRILSIKDDFLDDIVERQGIKYSSMISFEDF